MGHIVPGIGVAADVLPLQGIQDTLRALDCNLVPVLQHLQYEAAAQDQGSEEAIRSQPSRPRDQRCIAINGSPMPCMTTSTFSAFLTCEIHLTRLCKTVTAQRSRRVASPQGMFPVLRATASYAQGVPSDRDRFGSGWIRTIVHMKPCQPVWQH